MRVLVVVTNYNYSQYIPRCIESIMEQNLTQIGTCVVVDDCSTDDSVETVKGIIDGDRRFSLVALPENRGVANARNVGISSQNSEYWLCFDADDIMYPTMIERMVEILDQDSSLGFVYCQPEGYSQLTPFDPQKLLEHNYITIATLVRRVFAPLQFDTQFKTHEDWLFWGTLARMGILGHYLEETLFLYRRHDHSASQSPTFAEDFIRVRSRLRSLP